MPCSARAAQQRGSARLVTLDTGAREQHQPEVVLRGAVTECTSAFVPACGFARVALDAVTLFVQHSERVLRRRELLLGGLAIPVCRARVIDGDATAFVEHRREQQLRLSITRFGRALEFRGRTFRRRGRGWRCRSGFGGRAGCKQREREGRVP
jgi:hypothetical protein